MNIKNILNDNNFVFKKKFGQNFLLDNNILNNIIDLASITKDTLVIEIGVGAAALTKKLSEKAGKVLGYEIDETLEMPLKEILKDYNNVDLIFDDFLNRCIEDDIKNYHYSEIIVVANLPYYITTPIITKFIDENINIERIIVMVQNEVADRFSAKVGTKSYNSLTIFLNYYFDIKKAFVVSRNVFYPKPNVDSAIVVFNKKRETLKNNLSDYDLVKIEEILVKHGKSLSSRAEELSIDDFAIIVNSLS